VKVLGGIFFLLFRTGRDLTPYGLTLSLAEGLSQTTLEEWERAYAYN
jgi:hypothetical protein